MILVVEIGPGRGHLLPQSPNPCPYLTRNFSISGMGYPGHVPSYVKRGRSG